MPQAPRKEAPTQRAQDKESKRARGALSCAECRRLKLKCDKTVPCSSCKRRGCSAICPNGSLITGQGTRFVLADTEKLHQKIAQMSDRIRQLEDGLAILQSTHTSDPHPLLHRDLMKIKSSLELHSAVEGGAEDYPPQETEETEESQSIDAFGTLAIRDDGAATFYGRSAGSESLLIGEVASPPDEKTPQLTPEWHRDSVEWNNDPAITTLSAAFPLASKMFQPGITIDYLIATYLPPWEHASRLCQLYLEQAPWFFGAVTKRQLTEEILPMWYQEAPKPQIPQSPGTDGSSSSAQGKGGAHDIALLFVIFCFGALTDMDLPAAPENPESERYYQLTKAALTLEPVLDRPPSVATVQTLSLMGIYEGLCSGENSIESTWALMGLATKLAQSIGLHRDCARWKLPPAEVQKRRALFWELFITDCWQSLATGRLATFSLPFVDCELPQDPDQTMTEDGTVQPSFPFWKARFGAECVSAVVQGTLTSRAPKYSIILQLDRKVRDMELPLYAQGLPPQGAGLSKTMSHFMPTNYRELTLLYIHRCFFAHAISSNPLDPIKSAYAPSFLAGYRSACTIISSVKQQFTLFPEQIARFWVLWTHAFSASVMLASVATHSSQSKVAPAALLELKTACDLFESASVYGGRAVKFLPILKRLQFKAQTVFRETNSGISPSIPGDIFKPSHKEEEKDELSIFSGKTYTVSTKVSGPSRSSTANSRPSPSNGNAVASSSRASSGSPRQAFTDNPSFADVHPSLVSELNGFDGQIRAQIQNAYRANSNIFTGAMVVDPTPQPGPSLHHQQEQNRQQFQLQLEQQERERRRLERQEVERKELERQELARQQLHAQRQQQQHQNLEQQQHQIQGQARHDPYQRQQLEIQQRQLHQQQLYQQQQHSQGLVYPQASSSSIVDAPMAAPSAVSPPNGSHSHSHSRSPSSLRHSQSRTSIRQGYQPQQFQPSPPQQVASPTGMFNYSHSPEAMHSAASTSHYTPSPTATTQYTPPATSYGSQSHVSSPVVPTYPSEAYQYWTAAPNSFAIPPTDPQPQPQQQYNGAQPYQPQQQHYTPEAALRGIAADDRSLQETWQSFMYKVGSGPRHLLDD